MPREPKCLRFGTKHERVITADLLTASLAVISSVHSALSVSIEPRQVKVFTHSTGTALHIIVTWTSMLHTAITLVVESNQ